MTEEEFFNKNGQTLHIRLLLFYNEYTNKEEKENQKDDDILFFEMENGRYSIRYRDLKQKADEETIIFIEKNGGDINNILNND